MYLNIGFSLPFPESLKTIAQLSRDAKDNAGHPHQKTVSVARSIHYTPLKNRPLSSSFNSSSAQVSETLGSIYVPPHRRQSQLQISEPLIFAHLNHSADLRVNATSLSLEPILHVPHWGRLAVKSDIHTSSLSTSCHLHIPSVSEPTNLFCEAVILCGDSMHTSMSPQPASPLSMETMPVTNIYQSVLMYRCFC